MNSKSKKSLFNKKNLIVIGMILVVLIVIVLILVLDNGKSYQNSKETIICSFEKNFQIMSITLNMKVDYINDEFNFVEEEYKMSLLNEKLIEQKDSIFKSIETKVLEKVKGTNITYNFEREENSIIMKLSMDSKNYELYNKDAKSLVGDNSLNFSEYYYGPESLKQSVESLGGGCQYE